jgi:hypothetical protein
MCLMVAALTGDMVQRVLYCCEQAATFARHVHVLLGWGGIQSLVLGFAMGAPASTPLVCCSWVGGMIAWYGM